MRVVCHGLQFKDIDAVVFFYSEYHPKTSPNQLDSPKQQEEVEDVDVQEGVHVVGYCEDPCDIQDWV